MHTNHLWMEPAERREPPAIVVFRCRFSVPEVREISATFSADERCDLFLDGEWIADGPERGTPRRWYSRSIRLALSAGTHCLTARVLCIGAAMAPYAQMSVRHGFHVREESGLLDRWEYRIMPGCRFHPPFPDWGSFPRIEADVPADDLLSGDGGGWRPVAYFIDERTLHEPDLPPMRRKEETAYRCAGSHIVFDDYVCVRSEFVFSGTGTVKIRWAESLYRDSAFDLDTLKGDKGRRDGSHWIGNYDIHRLPGGRCRVVEPWMRAGRHLEIVTEGDCRVERMTFHRTGYPYRPLRRAESSSPELNRLLPSAFRTLELCSHETFMDCPFYEQLMYIGDARMEALTSYVTGTDDRLIIKSLRLLADSQRPDGMIASRYPDKTEQFIPVFALCWISMLYDFARWRNDPEVVKELLPVSRRIIRYLKEHMCNNLPEIPGWKFIDWVPGWNRGVPPGDCAFGWFAVKALQESAALEEGFGTAALATENRRQADITASALRRTYFNPADGLFADEPGRRCFSEPAQVIAILAGENGAAVPDASSGLPECSIYFSHYYLEACRMRGLSVPFFRRLAKWYGLEKLGLKTLPEEFGNPRSDCHAWGAHVLYHYYASILGLQPVGWGGNAFDLSPLPEGIDYAEGTVPHCAGEIFLRRERCGNRQKLSWNFPPGLAVSVQNRTVPQTGEMQITTGAPFAVAYS